MTLDELVVEIERTPYSGLRRVVALVGSPASGKSSLADKLVTKIDASCVVPMDGFHLDNGLLLQRDLIERKGAPQTFDVAGFVHIVGRLKQEREIVYPVFDRTLDKAIAGAGCVAEDIKTVIVEGNYLLLDQPGWRELSSIWDLSITLAVSRDVLCDRLIRRWLDHGFSEEDARKKAEGNDLKNADQIEQGSLPADIVLEGIAI